jgi:hypothetical protein
VRVYLAAPYQARAQIRRYASSLRNSDIRVECSWLRENYAITPGTTGAATDLDQPTVAGHCWDDILEVTAADLLVVFTEAVLDLPRGSSTGGRHVETGLAIGAGIPVLVVGEPENIFHRMGAPEVTVRASWLDAYFEITSRNLTFKSRVRETN